MPLIWSYNEEHINNSVAVIVLYTISHYISRISYLFCCDKFRAHFLLDAYLVPWLQNLADYLGSTICGYFWRNTLSRGISQWWNEA